MNKTNNLNYERKELPKVFGIGNVRVVISDIKEPNATYDQFTADLKAYYNYYAFGMLQPNRWYTLSEDYNFVFNEQLRDDEIKELKAQRDDSLRKAFSGLAEKFSADPVGFVKDVKQGLGEIMPSSSPPVELPSSSTLSVVGGMITKLAETLPKLGELIYKTSVDRAYVQKTGQLPDQKQNPVDAIQGDILKLRQKYEQLFHQEEVSNEEYVEEVFRDLNILIGVFSLVDTIYNGLCNILNRYF